MILVLKPFFELERRGAVHFDFATSTRWSEKALLECDLLLVLRGNTLSDLRALRLAERHAIPVVYDIDDNFHEISPAAPVGEALRSARSIAVVERFFRAASVVRVYNPLMQELALKCQARRVRLENAYFDPPPGIPTKPLRANPEKIRILYASARRGCEQDEVAMAKALSAIARRHEARVEIVLWKGLGADGPRGPNVRVEETVPDYGAFLRRMADMRPAIGLAPLGEDRFFLSKTNNKYREYGGLGIPAIYSRTALYESCIRDGQNGLLVGSTAAEWENAIERLVGDEALRSTIIRNATADVAADYGFESFLRSWMTLLDELPLRTVLPLAGEGRGRPTVAVVGNGWRRAPISRLLVTQLAQLGASLDRRATVRELKADDVFIYAPNARDPFPSQCIGHGVVDVSLIGGGPQLPCTPPQTRFIVMAGCGHVSDPAIQILPDPGSDQGRLNATGTEALLMPLTESLLDSAPLAKRPLKRLAPPVRSGILSRRSWVRLGSQLMQRSREAGDDLDRWPLPRPSTIAKVLASALRLRFTTHLYERRLRQNREI